MSVRGPLADVPPAGFFVQDHGGGDQAEHAADAVRVASYSTSVE
jgi:hypothetical protein